jgi:hypothetical protein
MSALPFTPLTITPRPPESRRPNFPSQREGAGGWVPSVTTAAASPNQPHALSPSQREGAGGRVDLDSPAPLLPASPIPLPFTPSDQTAAAILDDFAAQDLTLRGIADKHDTTLEALTLWLARPDIAQRLVALESACAARARLVVANNLAAIANKLLHLLDEAKLDHESIHRVPATTHHAFSARMQSRESARKTANLLLRIARYTPLNNTTPPTSPSPNGSPTRERGVADAHLAPLAPAHQPSPIAPPLPAPREVAGKAPELYLPNGRPVGRVPAPDSDTAPVQRDPNSRRGHAAASNLRTAPQSHAHQPPARTPPDHPAPSHPGKPDPRLSPHPLPIPSSRAARSPVTLAGPASVQAPNQAAGP